jgi:hypothetical protein
MAVAPALKNVHQQLVALDAMTVSELAAKYREVFGQEARSRNKTYLAKRIAWRIQELAEGGLSDRAKRRIEELAKDAPIRQLPPRTKPVVPAGERERDPRLPRAGTLLTKMHAGREHVVKVLVDAFEYRGKHYTSLSAIAKVITGTNWNGIVFFGLAKRATKATKAA